MSDTLNQQSKESRMGAMGSETREREIRRIDLSDFERRKDEIGEQLWSASVDIGFFQRVNHSIDVAEIRAFMASEALFAPPGAVKACHR